MAGSTISSTITNQVTLGYGVTISPLTITNKGEIDYAGGYAILVNSAYAGTIINDGSIIGRTDGIYAGGYAVTIFNHGTIFGTQSGISLNSSIDTPNVVANSAAISGNVGIAGSYTSLTNTGVIDGVVLGVRLISSEVTNSGTITGEIGAEIEQTALSNTGTISGSQIGLYLGGGNAVNFGSISGIIGVQIADIGGNGSLTNHGTISGGVTLTGGTLVNDARITGTTGVSLTFGGNATNAGTITGQSYGVAISGPANATNESFVNSATVYGQVDGITISGAYAANSGNVAAYDIGVVISGGQVMNSGVVSAQNQGVAISGGSLSNSGTIYGHTLGVAISGGTVTNFETISGKADGALLNGGSLENFGVISGGTYGVANSGGSVTNYGIISSSTYGVMLSHGMVTNAGTISGGKDAIYGSFITLAVDPGAAFVGDVINQNGEGLLDLNGSGVGNLGGIGSQITGFKDISFGSNADWTIAGNATGLGNGVTIAGMARVDTIVLDGFAATASSFVSGFGLEMSNATNSVTLDITGSFSNGGLRVTESGGNTVITDVTCYAAGTRIATPSGEIAVEQLRIGDLVRTLHAGDRAVKWVGWRRYDGRLIRGNLAALPICIRQNAIADGVPQRDLFVSPGHAIAIDNVLIHASRLLNGISVVQLPDVESVTYYHVELENHEIIFAENCPAESFQDEHFRKQFHNAEEYRRLYPAAVAPAVMCLPRLDSGFQLYAIQRRVAARAGIAEATAIGALLGYVDQNAGDRCFGWAQDIAAPGVPVTLDILSGGRLIGRVLANLYREDVLAAGYGDGYQGFEFLLTPELAGAVEVRRTLDGARLKMAETGVPRAA